MTFSHADNMDLIPPFLDRRPLVWTYTMLSTYRNVCAHQAYRRYLLRKGETGHIPFVMTPQVEYGNKAHEALEYRVMGGKPLPPDMLGYEKFAAVFDGRGALAEPKLAVTRECKPTGYFDKDVWGRGRADIVLMNDTKAYIADWKTGKVREDPFELEIQALLLRAKHPQLRTIIGQYVWLKEDCLGRTHDLSDVAGTWKTVCEIVDDIEHDRSRGVFDKKKGPLCGWCDVKDCHFNTKR